MPTTAVSLRQTQHVQLRAAACWLVLIATLSLAALWPSPSAHAIPPLPAVRFEAILGLLLLSLFSVASTFQFWPALSRAVRFAGLSPTVVLAFCVAHIFVAVE